MEHIPLFPLADYWWFYGLFTLFVLGLLALDLGVFHRKAHAVGVKEAFAWTTVWITLSLLFCGALWLYGAWKFPLDPRLAGLDHAALAKQTALEYLAGYVVEASLSVDNIFVFVVVFSYFAIPPQYQHRVLFWGILGALILRAAMIVAGAALIAKFAWIIYLFGGFLILTGLKMIFKRDEEIHPERNPVVKWFKRLMPVTNDYRGDKFFVRENGVRMATPLFIVLLGLPVARARKCSAWWSSRACWQRRGCFLPSSARV